MTNTNYYLGELMCIAGDFAPVGWMPCEGQILPINRNQGLFSLLGNAFGGDGQTNFAIPDLRGRVTMGAGDGPNLRPRTVGQAVGRAAVTLQPANLPAHRHTVSTAAPNAAAGSAPAIDRITAASGDVVKSPAPIQATGASQPIDLTPPAIVMTWCICVDGMFPS